MRKKSADAPLRCLVTAGPTFEPLDEVRRLTNFSTGTLGCNLADFLSARGHSVKLLLGHYATHKKVQGTVDVDVFTTTNDLRNQFEKLSGAFDAIFHAAAVSDFKFGQVFRREGNALEPVKSGKLETRGGLLLAELVPTEKILPQLRQWHPKAVIAGWKYEVDGSRDQVLQKARQQLKECKSDACVPNGPAYGLGFGLVRNRKHEHFQNRELLFVALEKFIRERLA